MLLLTYLIGGLNFFIFLNQYTYIAFVLSDAPFNLSSFWIGLLFVTYFTGTVGSAISGKVALKLPVPLGMALGVLILMLGTLITLSSSLWLIVSGFFINALYLQPFWQWQGWSGVVVGALLMYSLTLLLCVWLWRRSRVQ